MQFSSLNTNFLTQGGATLDPCQGLCPWTHIGGPIWAGLDPTCGFLRFALGCFSLQAIPKSWKPCIKPTCRPDLHPSVRFGLHPNVQLQTLNRTRMGIHWYSVRLRTSPIILGITSKCQNYGLEIIRTFKLCVADN